MSEGQYIEILGTVVAMVSIDSFCLALDQPLNALPDAHDGEPTAYRPASAGESEAWVPLIPVDGNTGAEADLWISGQTGYVVQAMSLVPDEVRTLTDLSAAHYLAMKDVRDPMARGEFLDRQQIELVAGRVSALNQCYYWTTAHATFLRVSSQAQNKEVNLNVVTEGNASAQDSLIPDSEPLVNFAEAIVGRDPVEIEASRNTLANQMCDQAMIAAAGVASNFQRMVRIADATGIPLGGFEEMSADIRNELELNDFLLQKQP